MGGNCVNNCYIRGYNWLLSGNYVFLRQKMRVRTFFVELKTIIMVKEIIYVSLLIIGVVSGAMYGLPKYRVWSAEQNGKAQFAEAEQNRRIRIEEAKANLEAEKLNAMAEIERAKGAAEAIKIENGSITPEYIQYLWVRQQGSLSDKTVIYIPTEANLPILEANRNGN